MNIKSRVNVKDTAITANIAALNDLLAAAARRAAEARELMQNGERNGAFGALLDFDGVLEDAKALYGAALALHRTSGY